MAAKIHEVFIGQPLESVWSHMVAPHALVANFDKITDLSEQDGITRVRGRSSLGEIALQLSELEVDKSQWLRTVQIDGTGPCNVGGTVTTRLQPAEGGTVATVGYNLNFSGLLGMGMGLLVERGFDKKFKKGLEKVKTALEEGAGSQAA